VVPEVRNCSGTDDASYFDWWGGFAAFSPPKMRKYLPESTF
jgi:hypothetical protein